MADQGGQVARMLRDSFWSRAEIQAWAACKPLVDRAYLRRRLYLGDDAWEELFDALCVPTLLLVPSDSLMAPRQEEVHNDLVRTVVVPGAGHCVRRASPPGASELLTRSSKRWRGPRVPGPRRSSVAQRVGPSAPMS
jgi:pimeloyl-ACP methyl ester carboxylesterase